MKFFRFGLRSLFSISRTLLRPQFSLPLLSSVVISKPYILSTSPAINLHTSYPLYWVYANGQKSGIAFFIDGKIFIALNEGTRYDSLTIVPFSAPYQNPIPLSDIKALPFSRLFLASADGIEAKKQNSKKKDPLTPGEKMKILRFMGGRLIISEKIAGEVYEAGELGKKRSGEVGLCHFIEELSGEGLGLAFDEKGNFRGVYIEGGVVLSEESVEAALRRTALGEKRPRLGVDVVKNAVGPGLVVLKARDVSFLGGKDATKLRVGDVIEEIDGKKVGNSAETIAVLDTCRENDALLQVIRDGKRIEVTLPLIRE